MAKIDRARALQLGLNAESVANNINTTLSSSEQVTPNFWTDPKSGIPYYIAVQTPEHDVSSLAELGNTPVSTAISLGLTPFLVGDGIKAALAALLLPAAWRLTGSRPRMG